MTKRVNNADFLERRLLAQQGNISKHAIHRSGPWVNTQILKMTQTEPQFRYAVKYIGWLCGWSLGWEPGVSSFPFSQFSLSTYNDGPQPLLTHRQRYWGCYDLQANHAQLFLSAGCARGPGDPVSDCCSAQQRLCPALERCRWLSKVCSH